MNNDFNKDVIYGEDVEQELIEILEKRGEVCLERGKGFGFDVWMARKVKASWYTYMAEAKGDVESARTQNAAIEFECRGKSSGIAITLSSIWYHKLEDGFWEIKTAKLKELIYRGKFEFVAPNCGDPGSHTKCYIFDGEYFRGQCIRNLGLSKPLAAAG